VVAFQIEFYVTFVYLFFITFRQIRHRRRIAILLLLSWTVVLLCGINDILYLNLIINTIEVAHFGFFIFLLTQAYILSYKIAGAFHTIEDLSVRLNHANINLEHKVEERTRELVATQKQLVQQEKLASLGQLTAGIAHEIKNPLNFVNNFSELSNDLVQDLEKATTETEKQTALADLKVYLGNISHHGKRADAIVKNMLEHSHQGTGAAAKQPEDINKLCLEIFQLAYHSMNANDPSFNCELKKELGTNIPPLNMVPQEISRVLLNLMNNAFYAVKEKSHQVTISPGSLPGMDQPYRPCVSISTSAFQKFIQINIRDNGTGIPENIREKIFNPFFTTKPAGKGTGLGLSLSYEIIQAHSGKIRVLPNEDEWTEFEISLPV